MSVVEDGKVTIKVGVIVEEEQSQTSGNILGTIGRRGGGATPSGVDTMQQGLSLARQGISNPIGMVSRVAMAAPVLAGAGAGVVAGLAAWEIAKMIREELIRPGGFMDIRFKRDWENSNQQHLSRQQQRDRAIGNNSQVIIGANANFMQRSGYLHSNTYRQIVEGTGDAYRQSKLGVEDHSYGGNNY